MDFQSFFPPGEFTVRNNRTLSRCFRMYNRFYIVSVKLCLGSVTEIHQGKESAKFCIFPSHFTQTYLTILNEVFHGFMGAVVF